MKRCFDFISAFVGLLIFSPLLVIVIVLIWLQDFHSPFYMAPRMRRRGVTFKMVKLRSMVSNADKIGGTSTAGSDKRITWVGRFIRKLKLDEFSQLWNVLIGDMSVVGPRPHMLSHTDMYANKVDKFMVRHFVKPGITGLAQVSGYRGEVESDSDIIGRVKFDIYYVENWSVLFDVKIIIKTIIKAVKGDEKAY